MSERFSRIEVPNPEGGITDKQRDRLQVDMANAINTIGVNQVEATAELRSFKNNTNREIYGDKEYPGIKAIAHKADNQCDKNRKWLNRLIYALIVAGGLGGGYLGLNGGV